MGMDEGWLVDRPILLNMRLEDRNQSNSNLMGEEPGVKVANTLK
jgi:hypothetical protein